MQRRHSKKLLVIILGGLTLCFLLFVITILYGRLGSISTTNDSRQSSIELHSIYTAFDVTVDTEKGHIGYADKDNLVIITDKGLPFKKMTYGNPSYELIAFDIGTHKWWAFDSSSMSFHVFNQDGNLVNVIAPLIPDLLRANFLKVHNDQYLLLAGENMHHEGTIWLYDLTTQTVTSYEPNGTVLSMLLTDNQTLVSLIASSTGLRVEWYNICTGITFKELEIETSFAASIGLDLDGNLFYTTNHSLYRAHDSEQVIVGHLQSIAKTVHNEIDIKIFPSHNGCYVWVRGENNISFIPYYTQDQDTGAIVVDASFYVPAAMSIFDKTGNKLDFRDQGIVSAEQYLSLMLSRDSSVDVYMLRSYNGSESRFIIEKGYYEDLKQSPIISADAQTWFSQLYQDSSQDGRLFGYPYGVAFQMLSINPTELDKLGIVLPQRQLTWHELLDLLEPYSGHRPFPLIVNPTHLIQLILWQAYNAPREEFVNAATEALDVLDRCRKLGMFSLSPAEYMSSYQFIDNFAMRIDLNTLGGNNVYPFIPVPSLASSSCGTPIWYDWLLINPYSTHKKQAFDYIEAHALAHTEGGLQWSAVLAPDPDLYPRFSKEWHDDYAAIMAHSTAYLVYPLEEDFMEICKKFTSMQISKNDALAQIVEKYSIAMAE